MPMLQTSDYAPAPLIREGTLLKNFYRFQLPLYEMRFSIFIKDFVYFVNYFICRFVNLSFYLLFHGVWQTWELIIGIRIIAIFGLAADEEATGFVTIKIGGASSGGDVGSRSTTGYPPRDYPGGNASGP
jgi:hypothetical protein